MCKNGFGEWEATAIPSRAASNDSHICGELSDISDLRNVNWDWVQQIKDLGFTICQAFDCAGYHMADLGIDMGMDLKGKLWIFEVNPLSYPYYKLADIQDDSMTRPLEYSHYLVTIK